MFWQHLLRYSLLQLSYITIQHHAKANRERLGAVRLSQRVSSANVRGNARLAGTVFHEDDPSLEYILPRRVCCIASSGRQL